MAIPLLALDAVVVDTETTGLDPTAARIVQIGAVRIRHLAVEGLPFSTLVNPGEAIPPESTRIHGIGPSEVAAAPGFPTAWQAFRDFAGESLLVGHTIGFDLAMFRRETGLAGLTMPPLRALDTRLLAQVCFPRLAGLDLDPLASHLGLEVGRRHDALADARLTAGVLAGLVPHLKERGIRTVEEAEEACRRLTTVLEGYQRAGWVEPIRPASNPDTVLRRIDAFPFRHRVRDLMSRPPAVVAPGEDLLPAVQTMALRKISSVFVASEPTPFAAETGIVTERDVLRRVAEHGRAALETTAGAVATTPVLTVPEDAIVYVALGRMDRHRIRHLGVTDAQGRIVGALSARDLLRVRASDALVLGDAIAAARSVPELALAWSRLPEVARRLLAEDVGGREIAAVVSHEIGALTARAAADAAHELGPAPAPYAILVLGSGGRGESLLAPDQDNAVVWADTPDDGAADRWFARHAELMTRRLDEVGIPLCKGQVMATNPVWRGSLSQWRERVAEWAERNRPEDLLSVDIYFDFRPVHGDGGLADALFRSSYDMAHRAPVLAKLLAAELDRWSPPLGFFGRLKAEDDGRIDLKRHGLFPIVAAARCLALRHGIAERATPARLEALRQRKLGADRDLAQLDVAHETCIRLLLRQQLDDIAMGRSPGNRVAVRSLGAEDVDALHRVFKTLAPIGDMVRDLLFST